MAIATAPSITILPPSAKRGLSFDEFSFQDRQLYPVNATFHGGDDWTSSGIDFSDYSRCKTQRHKQSGQRRLATPVWALKPEMLRALIVRTMEKRAGIVNADAGTDAERLARAQARIAAIRVPAKQAALTRMCREYVAMKNNPDIGHAALTKYGQSIESLDSELRAMLLPDRGASQIAGVVSFYYSLGLDSVGVAAELGIKPPAVRRLLWALHRIWARMQKEAPAGWCGPRIRINLIKSSVEGPCEKCGKQREKWQRRFCLACTPWKLNMAANKKRARLKKRCGRGPNSPDAIRRRNQLAQGICGIAYCTNQRWDGRCECKKHILFYNALAREQRRKNRAARA